MSGLVAQVWEWIWPRVGPTPISQGLDFEMFDRPDYPYSETFVREAIQNSLDARLNTEQPVISASTFTLMNSVPAVDSSSGRSNFVRRLDMRFRRNGEITRSAG